MTLPLNLKSVVIGAFDRSGKVGRGLEKQKFIVAEVRENGSGEVLGLVIRSYASSVGCNFHRDILARLNEEVTPLGLNVKCIGGGVIDPRWWSPPSATPELDKPALIITDTSREFGHEPDRNLTLAMIKSAYPDYLDYYLDYNAYNKRR